MLGEGSALILRGDTDQLGKLSNLSVPQLG